eukprot:TRINITY_DN107605_c0_g1_i1.p1 TRINITY_DN107605_c0_g1~~TRINITY_DN107605_c0_g1_i1.p1  ORF type:complete len:270 (-),score=30.18 TRINITY_DN107605_c0_g1_i1:38-847(-)
MARTSPIQRFLLIRHGESTANAAPLKQRLVDAKLIDACLTLEGEAQARSMGQITWSKFSQGHDTACLHRGFCPDLVVVSPFTRALQTACLITAQWKSRPSILVDPLVREYFSKYIPEIIGRPQSWLRTCPTLQNLEVFAELQWDDVPEADAAWWSPSGRQEQDTIDLQAGKHRIVDFVRKMGQRKERDIVVVAHGTALGRAFKYAPEQRKEWDNCEARLCTWSCEEELFVQIDHPDFPLASVRPNAITSNSCSPSSSERKVPNPSTAKL